ncbi:hypothetical protein Tco_0873440 [Tanacetum coccineum]|uniref:Uncharacterized protein n=1 Tax=Tanacetum coccineum TaxID=301880 RepID=A0ABQ5BKH1_9ASTR
MDTKTLTPHSIKYRNISTNTEEQPKVEAASKHDWFKKPKRPLTPDPDWNTRQSIDFRPPHKWISRIAKATKPPSTFDELMNTPIDFSAYVMIHLKIDNLTQQILVGPAFNLLKGTCKSRVKLEFHFEECYKVVNDKLYWHNPEGHQYPFDLSKPLQLIKVQGRQVVLADYFINNDLKYLKGGSLSRRYTTSTTKTKAAKYDNIEGTEDMWYDYRYVASLGSEEDFKPSKRCHLRFERSIKDVHQTSRHSEVGERSLTRSRKLPEEA